MSDRQREMFGDPYADLRDSDSHVVMIRQTKEMIADIEAGTYSFARWQVDESGKPLPGVKEGTLRELRGYLEEMEAEVAAGRLHPVDTAVFQYEQAQEKNYGA